MKEFGGKLFLILVACLIVLVCWCINNKVQKSKEEFEVFLKPRQVSIKLVLYACTFGPKYIMKNTLPTFQKVTEHSV